MGRESLFIASSARGDVEGEKRCQELRAPHKFHGVVRAHKVT